MQRETKGFVAGLTALVFSTGLGAALGHGAYEIVNNPEAQIEEKQAELEEIQEHQLVLDQDRDIIVADLGESCMRLVTHYLPEGDLEETSEDTIVQDLLQEPGVPCGDSATEIRSDVRNLTVAEVGIAENRVLSDELNDSIDEAPAGDLVNQVGLIALGTVVGFGIGLGLAVKTEDVILNSKKALKEKS